MISNEDMKALAEKYPMTGAELSKALSDALEKEREALKTLGSILPFPDARKYAKKLAGLKWYYQFWNRKLYMAQATFKMIEQRDYFPKTADAKALGLL